ncbi:MAG TPA: cation:proton antiporter, partial [Solirubrobacteraceae bacterium]|nr:cation:proton antiporter [Solirubrobacteraceae bacterium]
MEIEFATGLTVLGLLLVGSAALSGLMHRTVLSIAVLSLGAGVVLSLAGILDVEPGAHALVLIVEVVLLVTLFSDGLLVEHEFLRSHWRAPARAIVIAMPVNAALLALMAKLLFGQLTWEEAFLIGFVLSPTDPVITSSVVSSADVPARVRNTLNLESGLNDGLALPFVLIFLALASGTNEGVAGPIGDMALETVLGFAIGGALGLAAGRLLDWLPDWAVQRRYEGLYALGLGLAAFGVADLVHGNGLIAAFSSGLVLAVTRHEIPEVFHHFNETVGSILQVVAFALFGAMVVATGFDYSLLALVAFIAFALFVARPASVLLAFVGVDMRRPEKLFIAWFGPKGIASMLFALFVLNSTSPDRTLLFDVAAFTILVS